MKPLRHFVIKYGIAGQWGDSFKEKTKDIDFSAIKESVHPLTQEKFYSFDFFLIDLADELGLHPDQLPQVRQEGRYTFFNILDPGDAQ